MKYISNVEPRRLGLTDGEDDEGMFPVTYTSIKSGQYNVYLFGAIHSPMQFIPAIEALEAAGPEDTVVINLSCPGGDLDSTDTFLQAMRESEGRVVVRASGGCHSAASVILLRAEEFTLSENFNCLIHNGACGAYGDFNKFAAAAKRSMEYMNQIMRQSYEGFLTSEEIDQLIEGKDFWVSRDEFIVRVANRQDYFEEAAKVLELASLPQPVKRVRKKAVAVAVEA